jgi:hypothetical protein
VEEIFEATVEEETYLTMPHTHCISDGDSYGDPSEDSVD